MSSLITRFHTKGQQGFHPTTLSTQATHTKGQYNSEQPTTSPKQSHTTLKTPTKHIKFCRNRTHNTVEHNHNIV